MFIIRQQWEALNIYSEFKDNKLLQDVMTADNIIPDEHDGSYVLVRETVECSRIIYTE